MTGKEVKEVEVTKDVDQEQELQKHKAAAEKAKASKKSKAKTPAKKKATKKTTAKKSKVKKADIYETKPHTKGIITTHHLELEFGMKAKTIRRYLRKMADSTKPRGPQRYEWEANSAELKKIRKNLEAVKESLITNVK